MSRMRRILQSAYTRIAVCAAFSGVHVAALFAATFPLGTVGWLFPLMFLLPGLLTMILIPGAWRRWYRWLVLAFLCIAVTPDVLALVLFTGQTWALYRSWFLERTTPLKTLFRPRPGKPAAAAGPAAGPRTVAEVIALEKKQEEAASAGRKSAGGTTKPAARTKASVQAAKSAAVRAGK